MDTLYSITLCFVVCLYEMHINCLADSRRLRIGHKKYRILRGPEQGVGVRQGPSCVSSLVPPGAGGPGRTPARPPSLAALAPLLSGGCKFNTAGPSVRRIDSFYTVTSNLPLSHAIASTSY